MEKVIIYSTSWCNICHSIMDWLDKTGIEYEERNIEDDKIKEEIIEKMQGKFSSVPITVIGDEIIEGFNRPAIKAALNKYNIK
jgi:Glutaredoxin and related proteins